MAVTRHEYMGWLHGIDYRAPRRHIEIGPDFPRIICLCGSTRFWREFQQQGLNLTLMGYIVLSIGAARAPDDEDKTFGGFVKEADFNAHKQRLDELHQRKIDLADEVLVLNVGGYIGSSTASEIQYARRVGKPVQYLEPLPL
jgi:tetrahydromethanopterin S-methyltransferase subunit G